METRPLYRLGAIAAVVVLALIPAQMVVFFVSPPPQTVPELFALFQRSPLLGLLAMDLIYLTDILLMPLVLLAVGAALWRARPAWVGLALVIAFVSTATYFVSNTAFEMLSLSQRHAAAATDVERTMLLGAGEAMFALYKGTAFNVSYVLAGVAGLLLAWVMFKSDVFGRATAYVGIGMNILALIPATLGTVGLIASLLFLLPFVLWLILVARKLFALAADSAAGPRLRLAA